MRIKSFLIFLIALWLGIVIGHSQNCTPLGQNPATAFPVCGINTFVQNNVPLCAGSVIPGPCGAGLADINPYWYRFTCYVGGTLGFLITPNNLADDYDWQLFDITGRNPNDVYTDPNLFVACNWSGFGGITGASPTGSGLIHCAGNVPIFSSMPTLIAGHDYLLLVSHFTQSQSGYQLVFTGGTAGITDPANPIPEVTTATPNCDGTQITVRFNKRVKCSSLVLNGSDFIITPAATIISAVGNGCTSSFDLDSVTLTLSAPLAPGNYTVAAVDGSDGNTLLDNCNRSIVVGDDAAFTIAAPGPLPMGTVTPPPCTPSSLTLNFTDPVKCNSVATNGSDFTITGPSAVTVLSTTAVNCNGNGETNTITIQLTGPILVNGNYQVLATTGTDGNTLVGQCNRQVTAGSIASFTLAPQPALAMGVVTPTGCAPTTLIITFADLINCSSVAANGSDFLVTGPSAVSVLSATAVNCNANGETNTINIILTGPVLVNGTYDVHVVNGGDGNTLTGQCNRQVTAGSISPFVLVTQTPVPMGNVTPPPCTPSSITITFAEPIACTSIAANGSDFVITGPSTVTVTAATAVNCDANGETNSITIQFSAPVLIPGNYPMQVATGSDGNTLIGRCSRQVTPGSNTSFTVAPQTPLPMGTIAPPSCSPSSIVINFSDPINCTSIAPNGSDFAITGPSAVTVSGAGGPCNAQTNTITILLSAPIITSGLYQLHMATGNDGNTLTGNCNRQTTVGDMVSFTIPPAQPVLMDSIVPVACSPSSLRLVFNNPIKCSSVASNGSDFIIAGASPVSVGSAAGSCDANGLTTRIDIQLASPVVVGGSYQLQLVAGSDGNTLISDCNRQTPPSSLSFIASDTVSAVFQHQVQYDCQTDIISFSHDGQHNVNQWTWTINGVAAGSLQSFTQNFSASSQNLVQLVVSNGVCSDTYTENIVLNNKVTAAFEAPDIICPEDTAVFINKSTGGIDSWQWNFGNGSSSASQNPPNQIYPLTGIETLYTVSLTVGNINGCRTTATRTVKVLPGCIIAVPTAFTPNNDGLNDHLYPINAIKAENLDFKVFNRWGQLVFHSRDWTQKWDGKINGKEQATNVFVWTLDYIHRDSKIKYSLKGTSTLIR